jgi:hypothetical protein
MKFRVQHEVYLSIGGPDQSTDLINKTAYPRPKPLLTHQIFIKHWQAYALSHDRYQHRSDAADRDAHEHEQLM